MRKHKALAATGIVTSVLVAGCGGGDGAATTTTPVYGSGNQDVPTDMYTRDIRVVDDNGVVAPGHAVHFEIDIISTQDESNVPVTFYLADKTSFHSAAEGGTFTHFELGTVVIPRVAAGTHGYSEKLVVPAAIPDGAYYLIATVDSLNVVAESNEQNNYASQDDADVDHISDISDEVVIQGAQTLLPDIDIKDAAVTDNTISLEDLDHDVYGADDKPEHHVEMNVHLESVGSGTVDLPVSACVQVSSASCIPLQMWDSVAGDYTDLLNIAGFPLGKPRSIHLSLHLPADGKQDLQTALNDTGGRATFPVVVSVNPNDAIEEDEAALNPDKVHLNDAFSDVVHFVTRTMVPTAKTFYPQGGSTGLSYSESYTKSFSNSDFGAGVSFSASASLNDHGAHAGAEGSVPVTVFGTTANFIEIDASAQVTPPNMQATGFDLDVDFAGDTVYSKSGQAGFDWTDDWSVTKSISESADFWVGPVPVTVSGGVNGTLGFGVKVALEKDFVMSMGPYANAGAFASAAINLLAASGGVRGNLTLVQDTFTAGATAGMTLSDGGLVATGTLNESIINQLSGPSGDVELYVTYPNGIQWCSSWGIPYPCGVSEGTASTPIVSWAPYTETNTLLSATQTF